MARPPIPSTPTIVRPPSGGIQTPFRPIPAANVVRPPNIQPLSIGDGRPNRAQATLGAPVQPGTPSPPPTVLNSRGLGKAQTRATIAPAVNTIGGGPSGPNPATQAGTSPNILNNVISPANLAEGALGVVATAAGYPNVGLPILGGIFEGEAAGAQVRDAVANSGLVAPSSVIPRGTLAQRTQQFNQQVNNRFFGGAGGRNITGTLAGLANLGPPGGTNEARASRDAAISQAYRELFTGAQESGGASISETEFRRLVNGGFVKADGTIDWVGAAQAGVDLGFDMQAILANDPTMQPASMEDLELADQQTAEAAFAAEQENQQRALGLGEQINTDFNAQSAGLDAIAGQAQANAGEVQDVARGNIAQAQSLPGQVEADFATQIQATEQMVSQQLDGFLQSMASGRGIIDQAKADALNVALSTYTQQTADAIGAMDVQQRNTEAQLMGDLTIPPSERARMVAMSRVATAQNKGDAAQRVVETHNKMVTDILGTFGGHLASFMSTAASAEGGLRQQGISNVAGIRQSAAERMAETRRMAVELQNTAGTLLNTASNELNSTLIQLETVRGTARAARDNSLVALLPEQATPWFDSYGLMDRDFARRMGLHQADQAFFTDMLNVELGAMGIEAQAAGPFNTLAGQMWNSEQAQAQYQRERVDSQQDYQIQLASSTVASWGNAGNWIPG